MANIRGKNDKVDAMRIAGYAYDKRDKPHLSAPKDHDSFSTKKVARQNRLICSHSLKAIDEDLAMADKALDQLIQADDELRRLFMLVTSVSGIGKVTAVQVIVATNEFKDINKPKKFACYSGVAPFTDGSGKIIKKARASHMANKKVKTLLHLSAIVAIQHNAHLKRFYERKVLEKIK